MRIFLFSIIFITQNLVASSIESVLVHPIFDKYYFCAEHPANQLNEMGDALGADCIIHEFVKNNERSWLKSYKESGLNNEDWFGWNQNVLAPIDGTITKININSITNEPGITGKGMATFLIIKNEEGINILLAHLKDIKVKLGDKVKVGQIIAKVGNNGQSWHPHIHIGAFKGNTPLQLRFDQTKIKYAF